MAECAMGPKDETANGLLSPVSLWPPARVWFRVAHSETSLQGALHVLIPWQETGFIIPGQRWEREVRRTGLAFGSEFKSPTSQFPQNILQENHTEKPKMLHPSNEAFWYLTTGLISRTFYSFFFLPYKQEQCQSIHLGPGKWQIWWNSSESPRRKNSYRFQGPWLAGWHCNTPLATKPTERGWE